MSGDRVEDIRFEVRVAPSRRFSLADDGAIKGKDRRTWHLFGKIHSLLTQQNAVADSSLGKLAALREFASTARVKCASLCWHT